MTSYEGLCRVRDRRDGYGRSLADHVAGVRPLHVALVELYTECYLDYRDRYLSIMDEYAHAGGAS